MRPAPVRCAADAVPPPAAGPTAHPRAPPVLPAGWAATPTRAGTTGARPPDRRPGVPRRAHAPPPASRCPARHARPRVRAGVRPARRPGPAAPAVRAPAPAVRALRRTGFARARRPPVAALPGLPDAVPWTLRCGRYPAPAPLRRVGARHCRRRHRDARRPARGPPGRAVPAPASRATARPPADGGTRPAARPAAERPAGPIANIAGRARRGQDDHAVRAGPRRCASSRCAVRCGDRGRCRGGLRGSRPQDNGSA